MSLLRKLFGRKDIWDDGPLPPLDCSVMQRELDAVEDIKVRANAKVDLMIAGWPLHITKEEMKAYVAPSLRHHA